jgi:hypothetical protein
VKTFVYYNLTRKVWSLRVKGLVWGHALAVEIRDAKFKVSEAGRQRVLRLKKKFVHAGVEGAASVVAGGAEALREHYDAKYGRGVEVSYNPFKGPGFFDRATGVVLRGADVVLMLPNRGVVAYGVQW